MKPTTPQSNAVLNHVFDQWNTEREQLFALVTSVERLLRPSENDGDSPEYNAWRLAELASDVLGSVRDFSALKEMAMGVQHGE